VAYRVSSCTIPMTLSDLESHFCTLRTSHGHRLSRFDGPTCVSVPDLVLIGQTVAEIWPFSIFQDGGHCRSGNMSETEQDRHVTNRKWYMTYRTAAIPTTLSDLLASFTDCMAFRRDFSYNYCVAIIDKIPTDTARRAVPLR